MGPVIASLTLERDHSPPRGAEGSAPVPVNVSEAALRAGSILEVGILPAGSAGAPPRRGTKGFVVR